jgi:glutamine synthetase
MYEPSHKMNLGLKLSVIETNFSTEAMRHAGGLAVIKKAMADFEKKHREHIEAYDPKGGEDNKRRLTGAHETARLMNNELL